MNFARDGFAYIIIAALLAAGMFAVALNRRSWPLWLLALALVVVALGVAYSFRDPARAGDLGAGPAASRGADTRAGALLPSGPRVRLNARGAVIADPTLDGELAVR